MARPHDKDVMLRAGKYWSLEIAKRNLVDGTLFMPRPDMLNDSLEVKFDMATPEDHLATVDATLAEVTEQRCEIPVRKSEHIAEFTEVHQQENSKFQAFCEQVGICSLARRPDHQAMWAYYGDQGNGLCLELAFTREVVESHQLLWGDVIYSDQPRLINRADDWRATFLELAKEHPQATVAELQRMTLEEPFRRRMGLRMAQRATSLKHTDWAHEKEVRLLGPHGGVALPILHQVLKRVHFVSFTSLADIAPILVKYYPEVEPVQWTFHHGELQAKGQPLEFKLIPAQRHEGTSS